MYYLLVGIKVLLIELAGVGLITGMFYLFGEKLSKKKSHT